MCNKRSTVNARINGRKVRVDPCMRGIIELLNRAGIVTAACCCGHGRYPQTIITDTDIILELNSKITIPRTRNFYRMDEDGFFFIPEILEVANASQ